MKEKTTTKTRYDYNSCKNQSIKGKFISREVYCNVNSLIEKIDINDDIRDEWENLTYEVCEYCGEAALSTDDENHGYYCESCGKHSNDYDTVHNEIFEYWAVSDYLYKKLKALGHPVWDSGSTYIWGRCTSGQAILLDAVISNICFDMEILEDQLYEWKVV